MTDFPNALPANHTLKPPGIPLEKTGFRFTRAQDDKRLRKAAQEFEAIFFQQMLNAMDKTVDREKSLFSGGAGEDTFREMLNTEIAKEVCMHGPGNGFANTPGASSRPNSGFQSGLGLAELVYRQSKTAMEQQRLGLARGIVPNAQIPGQPDPTMTP